MRGSQPPAGQPVADILSAPRWVDEASGNPRITHVHPTGVFFDFPDFSAKRLELLREVLRKIWSLSVFCDPCVGLVQLNALKRPAGSIGFRFHVIEVKSASDIEQAFAGAKGSVECTALPLSRTRPCSSHVV